MDLEAIKTRVAAATPGPWEIRENFPYAIRGKVIFSGRGEQNRTILRLGDGYSGDADVAFIAHAREDVPALIAELEQLRQENEQLRAALEVYADESEWIEGKFDSFGPPWEIARAALDGGKE